MSPLKKSNLLVFDFLSGESRVVEKMPFVIGGQIGADWKVDSVYGPISNEVKFSINGSDLVVIPQNLDEVGLILNGELFEKPIKLNEGDQLVLKIGSRILGIMSSPCHEVFDETDLSSWALFDGLNSLEIGTVSFDQLANLAASSGISFENLATKPTNFAQGGFWLRDLHDLLVVPQPTSSK